MEKTLMDIDQSENSKPYMEIKMNIIIRKLFFISSQSHGNQFSWIHEFKKDKGAMATNCQISKEIYQFLPAACLKMRAISKSYSLKIATHVSNVIVLFEVLSGPLSTDMNSMGFRKPSFKHAPLNSPRDGSGRKSSTCEAAELLSNFPLRIVMYVGHFQPIEPSLFFSHAG